MATRQIPWARIFAEGVAIVVSILLAFGIQAWWEGRQQRREEAEYLAAIAAEIDQNLEVVPGNRGVLERSYSDLLRAQSLLRSGAYEDSAMAFVVSLNRGLIYGVPSISTAVFEDLSNSGRMVVIEDLEVRRRIMALYATIEAELVRFAPPESFPLRDLADFHTPAGLLSQTGPRLIVNEDAVPPRVLGSTAEALASEPMLEGALNSAIRRRERERAFLDQYETNLRQAQDDLTSLLRIGVNDASP